MILLYSSSIVKVNSGTGNKYWSFSRGDFFLSHAFSSHFMELNQNKATGVRNEKQKYIQNFPSNPQKYI